MDLLTSVSSLLATLTLLLDKNDLDSLWHSDIKRTDCFKNNNNKKLEEAEERELNKITANDKVFQVAFLADSTFLGADPVTGWTIFAKRIILRS